MGNLSGKKVLMVLAPNDFRDEEFFKTRVPLQANGAIITVASKGVEEATGSLGGKAKVDIQFDEVKLDDYDALVFVGGSGSKTYFRDKKAWQLAQEAVEKDKVLGAICITPSILANAGVLSGKRATSFSSEEKNLVSQKAKFTNSLVEADGKIITASGPAAAEAFGKKLAEVLG